MQIELSEKQVNKLLSFVNNAMDSLLTIDSKVLECELKDYNELRIITDLLDNAVKRQ